MPTRGSFTILRVRGVPVRVHWSLLLILPYIAVVFSAYFARVTGVAAIPAERVSLPPLFWGVLLAVGLFASVAIHELAHTLVAIRAGGRVHDITLMLLGGVSRIERMPPGKGTEALMAAAGPATSLALGAALLALHGMAPSGAADVHLGLFYLGQINLVLGVFNLVPAFPMDGGRVLRALLAIWLGRLRATRAATLVGKTLAVAMALFGVWTGNYLLLLIAIFVYAGAGQELRAEETRQALEGLQVGDLMLRAPPAVQLDAPVAILPARMRAAGSMELVVVDEAHRPVGVVRAQDLLRLSPEQQATLEVGDLGPRLSPAAVLATPNEPATEALDRAQDLGADYVIAVERDSLHAPFMVGLVRRRELEQALLLRGLEAGRGGDTSGHRLAS